MKKLLLCFAFPAFLLIAMDGFAQVIYGGGYHSLFLCRNGSLRACGNNAYGQLGDGTNADSNIPVQLGDLLGIISASAGSSHSLFLKNDGTVWTYGWNDDGQLGDGTNTSKKIPVQLSGLTGIISISARGENSLFLKNDGTVWACGNNYYGQLGDGTNINKNIPVQVSGLSGIISVSSGGENSLFLKNDGTVWACGMNGNGELGDGTNTDKNIPVQVNLLSGIISVSAGRQHSLFLRNDGTVWACGWNFLGQLGDGTNTDKNIPVKLSGLSGIISVAAGENHSLFLKNNGTMWTCGYNDFGQLGDGTNTHNNTPMQLSGHSGIISVSAGRYHSLFLKNNGTVWACGYNGSGQLGDGTTTSKNIPVQVQNLCYVSGPEKKYAHYLQGNLYGDTNKDCKKQGNEPNLPFIALNAMPGNIYSSSNDTGCFSIGINDSVAYILRPLIPQQFSYMLKNICPPDYAVSLPVISAKDSAGFDFGFDFLPCHHLRVSVASNRRRRCFKNITNINYWNEGFIAANSVQIHVQLPQYVIPLSASLPYTWDTGDSSIVFNVGTLGPQQSGVITLVDSVACVNGIMGLTQCTRAWILPPNQCYIDSTTGSSWDKSSMKVKGSCQMDTIRFVICNQGSGNMTSPGTYRIYADNVLQQNSTFQLSSGDSLVTLLVSGGATMRLEADQSLGHPGNSHPQLTMEGCGTDGSGLFSMRMVNQIPRDDVDPDVSIQCLEIIDSYDPNYKAASPSGIGTQKIVLPDTPIDFDIHFQNNGSDTAYTVVIIDTLSNDYDLSTFLPGAASHPYKTNISGEGAAILKFTFDKINLVDSATNEPLSNGFVSYRITPKHNLPLGTKINNIASIFFDYNFPILTKNAFVTLGNYSSITVDIKNQTSFPDFLRAYPNPAADVITVESAKQLEKIIIYSLDGRRLSEISAASKKIVVNLKYFAAGFYILDCKWQDGNGKLKFVKD